MPELPEVETIVRALRLGERGGVPLLGRTFAEARVLWARTVSQPNAADFAVRLVGQRVENIDRRGKFIVLHLSHDTLLTHLRMSGDLRVEPDLLEPAPHDRVLLVCEDGLRLAFNDPRKFGRMWLTDNPDEILGGLGPEPLSEQFTPALLYDALHARKRQLKPLLLDQSFLAGLGNIYTDEALHLARLHPRQLSDAITPAQTEELLNAIRTVLQEGIDRNGASIDWVYRGGDFQNHFRAYQRTGQPCPVCGTSIERSLVGQRGTHFCPTCQRLSEG